MCDMCETTQRWLIMIRCAKESLCQTSSGSAVISSRVKSFLRISRATASNLAFTSIKSVFVALYLKERGGVNTKYQNRGGGNMQTLN